VYVRGLIEQGGRKSLQPTLFRLEESPARYAPAKFAAEVGPAAALKGPNGADHSPFGR
jgi:hypothetical protein